MLNPMQLPPHSRETEIALIGGLFQDQHVFDDVRAILAGGDLYFDAHQKVFAAIESQHRAGQPADLHLVFERLRAAGQADDVGGAAFLAEAFNAVPTGLNAVHHARILAGYAARRRLIHACNEVLRDAYDGASSPEDMAAAAERRVQEATAGGWPDEPAEDRDLLGARLQAIDARASGTEKVLTTGLCDLDAVMGGLPKGELIIVGARPSTGKTSYALTVAHNVARQDTGVYVASLEMTREGLGDRLLSLRAGVPFNAFTGERQPTPEQRSRLNAAALRPPGTAGVWIDDKLTRTSAGVFAAARRAVRRWKVGLVVVDYLQLIRGGTDLDVREQEVAEASATLKRLAVTCNIPVLCLAQLNRAVEKENRRPRLSDLRESGSIEQDADKVLFLHTAEGQEDDKGKLPPVTKLEILVEKNRNGETGLVTVSFNRPLMRMDNRAKGYP